MTVLVTLMLALAALALLAPSGAARVRWRLLRMPPVPAAPPGRAAAGSAAPFGSAAAREPAAGTIERPRLRAARWHVPPLPGPTWTWGVIAVPVAGALAAGLLGVGLAGPTAGVVLAAYGGSGCRAGLRGLRRRAEERSRRGATEAVGALAADLRAGLPVDVALARAAGALPGPDIAGEAAARVNRRIRAAVNLAQTSGAPLADVLDRLDGHLRAADRARSMAAAQAAGARASAVLLAVMPVAGVGLGFVVGADALAVLLHSPLGSVCLFGAVGLQLAGLAWSARLSRVVVPE